MVRVRRTRLRVDWIGVVEYRSGWSRWYESILICEFDSVLHFRVYEGRILQSEVLVESSVCLWLW